MPRTWSPRLAVGVPAIDAQHQELFARADALLDAMREGRGGSELAPLLGFLSDYVETHFQAEERLMRQVRHPGYTAHKAQHDRFRSDLAEAAAEIRQHGARSAAILQVNGLVGNWLVAHIGSVDLQLAAFLGEQGGAVEL